MRLLLSNNFIKSIYNFGIIYPSPSNFNIMWNFGSLALLFLIIQILTGIFLGMNFVGNENLAFSSVDYIMREVNFGWLIRYIHANGASFFFFVIYMHIARGLYYNSFVYPRQWLWISGVIIFLLMIVTAFLGYVLPWGQMSFWAATVITNLLTAIPVIGYDLVEWVWGGFAVNNATLNRFYSLHYFLPFVILAIVILHLILLHEFGSSNPLGLFFKVDFVTFSPYYTIKDIFGVFVILIFFSFIIFAAPNYLGHSDNFIKANSMVTPVHIVPEWYFLPFYAFLRSLPNKLLGVCLLLASILVLIILPFFYKPLIKGNSYDNFYAILPLLLVVYFLWLMYFGGRPVETPYLELSQIFAVLYFLNFLIIWLYMKLLLKDSWKFNLINSKKIA
jgi:quinol-cytochrome oxidoreductase complex cytochrome b subunit